MSDAAPVADGVSAGTLLREAREAAGLHVATLAANLKVPVRKLEALEEDRYDLLPDAVFVRALASSVCRTLKVDPQPVLSRLPQTSQPRLVPDSEGINAPFRAPGDAPRPGVMNQLTRPVTLMVLALLLGALVLVFLPIAQRNAPAGAPGPEVAAAPPAGQAEPVMPPPAAGDAPTEQALSASTVVVTPAVPANLPAAAAPAPAPAAAASAPIAAAAPASAAAAAVPLPSDGVVVFRTRGPSWIQVTDATGTTVLRRLMNSGEVVGTGGQLPLSVTVGDAAQTEVQVRGKPFDLGPIARDNVARFEVK